MTIPLIDLALDEAAVAAALGKACETAGFFYIVNHGVPDALVRDQFAWCERFFDLPLAAKQAVAPAGELIAPLILHCSGAEVVIAARAACAQMGLHSRRVGPRRLATGRLRSRPTE